MGFSFRYIPTDILLEKNPPQKNKPKKPPTIETNGSFAQFNNAGLDAMHSSTQLLAQG